MHLITKALSLLAMCPLQICYLTFITMKLYLNGISVITHRTKTCVRMRVREVAVMVLSPQVLVPEIPISLYYSMTANFKRRVRDAYL
jgi:hypothetical protein